MARGYPVGHVDASASNEAAVWCSGARVHATMGRDDDRDVLPSSAPMILLYGNASRHPGKSSERVIPAEIFAMTYVVMWVLTGAPVYLAWVGIGRITMHSTTFAAVAPYVIAATLLATGFYQLSPAKRACLRQCESPVDFLMRRWRA